MILKNYILIIKILIRIKNGGMILKILFITKNPTNLKEGISTHCRNVMSVLGNKDSLKLENVSAVDFKSYEFFNKNFVTNKQINKFIKKNSYDIYHLHGFSSFFVIKFMRELVKLNKKIFYTPHYHPFSKHKHPKLAKIFFNFFTKNYLSELSKIIVLTEKEKNFFNKYSSNIVKIPNGHSFKSNIKELDVKNKSNYILFVGRLDHNKGFFHLRESELLEKTVVVTNKSDAKKIRKKCKEVHVNISNEKIKQLYKKALLTVIPSKYEAFSLVALESLANGTPVIISDNVQIKEYLDSDISFEFKYGNVEDFKNKVNSILTMKDNNYETICKKSIEVSQNYTWDKVGEQIYEEYISYRM